MLERYLGSIYQDPFSFNYFIYLFCISAPKITLLMDLLICLSVCLFLMKAFSSQCSQFSSQCFLPRARVLMKRQTFEENSHIIWNVYNPLSGLIYYQFILYPSVHSFVCLSVYCDQAAVLMAVFIPIMHEQLECLQERKICLTETPNAYQQTSEQATVVICFHGCMTR